MSNDGRSFRTTLGMAILALFALFALFAPGVSAADRPAPALPENMVVIPAGSFTMGCNEAVDAECRPEEYPPHRVTLSAFAIDLHEVSVTEYARCVAAKACDTQGLKLSTWLGNVENDWAFACTWDKPGHEDHPINCVNRAQAESYCRFVGKRLPTEAEWERAARQTDARKYPWGNDSFISEGPARVNMADAATAEFLKEKLGWCVKEYRDGYPLTAPVGSFTAGDTPTGLHDMTGNVAEWVRDNYSRESYSKSARNNPLWTKPSDSGVLRGGSWYDSAFYTRTSYRFNPYPTDQVMQGGIRCVMDLAPKPLKSVKAKK